MAITIEERPDGKLMEVQLSGKIHKEDYERLVPEVDRLVRRHGKIRMILEMTDFHGWDAGALWEDIKFDLRHFSDFERISMVGEKKWQKGLSQFCRPFTTAKIRYFDHSHMAEAREWAEAA